MKKTKPLKSKLTEHDLVYRVVIEDPKPGAQVKLYCDGQWLGIGVVKKYPDCKITGAVKNAYGPTMGRILKRLRKRLNKKVAKRLEKMKSS